MSEFFNEISADKFSAELRNDIYRISKQNSETINLFYLVNCELSDNSFRNLLNKDDFKLPSSKFNNPEIIARINDLKFSLNDKSKIECLQIAVENYFKIYKKTNEIDYLIRAFELIRKVKSLYVEKLSNFELEGVEAFFTLENSYYQLKLINSISFLLQENSITSITNYAINTLNSKYQEANFSDALNYIGILTTLKHFSKNQSKIQIAICLEKEADYYVSQKQPNTYYPTILSIYTKALRETKGIAHNDELKARLQTKIKIEQNLHFEMLTKIGVDTNIKPDTSAVIEKLNIINFQSAFNHLIEFPIIENDILTSKIKNREKTFYNQFFKDYVRVTNKGTVSGISDEDKYYITQGREHFRNTTISFLKELKFIMDINHSLISKKVVTAMIIKCNSSFVPKDREYFFIEGIFQGFQNNFSLASHLLMPQIENSLKLIIELNGRNTIKLTEDIQTDNTLGSILSIEENNKMLNGICNSDLLLELNSFLCDGNSVNFRNRLCHGLISPFETEYFGIYLWWLTLKMIKQTDKYFTISN